MTKNGLAHEIPDAPADDRPAPEALERRLPTTELTGRLTGCDFDQHLIHGPLAEPDFCQRFPI
jgi:hypothetical protein